MPLLLCVSWLECALQLTAGKLCSAVRGEAQWCIHACTHSVRSTWPPQHLACMSLPAARTCVGNRLFCTWSSW